MYKAYLKCQMETNQMSLAFKTGQHYYQLYNHVFVYVPVYCTGVWISKKNLLE